MKRNLKSVDIALDNDCYAVQNVDMVADQLSLSLSLICYTVNRQDVIIF